MNFGVEEAMTWALNFQATLKGYGGPLLLQSYPVERRPMMIRALECRIVMLTSSYLVEMGLPRLLG